MDLVNGRLDAVVIDLAPANAYVEKNPGLKTIEDPTFETEEYAIAVKKGNTELLETINTVLQRLKDDGSIERFAEEYSKQ